MSNAEDLHKIELTIKAAQTSIKVFESYKRLLKNKDFKYLIEEIYFEKNAARLVMLRGDSALSDEAKESVLKEIDATGTFRDFLRSVAQAGHQANASVAECNKAREEILAEGV